METNDEYEQQALSGMHDEAKALLGRSEAEFLSAKDDDCVIVMARGSWKAEILKIIEGPLQ